VVGVKIPAVLQERASAKELIQLKFSPQGQIRYLKGCCFAVEDKPERDRKWQIRSIFTYPLTKLPGFCLLLGVVHGMWGL